MRYERESYVTKAKAAWGDPLPDWIEALARGTDQVGAAQMAKNIGYSRSALSYVLANKYPGDIQGIREKVRGALMGITVVCPVYGEMGRDQCLDFQKVTPPFSSGASASCYRYCRGISVAKCPNSRLPGGAR